MFPPGPGPDCAVMCVISILFNVCAFTLKLSLRKLLNRFYRSGSFILMFLPEVPSLRLPLA